MENHLKILIVLYNKKYDESETILSLSKSIKNIKSFTEILIWDNSEIMMPPDQQDLLNKLFDPIKVIYHGNGKNTALSIIYNEIIKTLKNEDVLIIFDHDSNIPPNYFTALKNSIDKFREVNLFLPIVKYDNKIVSPANSWFFKGSYWKEENYGLIESNHQNAINSGMAIKASYLKNDFVGYDERLQFYGTDSDFMYKYSKQNKFFCVFHSIINHKLDFYENKDINSKLSRFRQMRKAALLNMKKINVVIYVLCYIYFILYSIKLVYLTKDSRFLS